MPSLNQIFFGPPGTGKTYATVEATLQILGQPFLAKNLDNRSALKARFDELLAAGDVRFVTFHQSFSYEDFVEGLRATTDEQGQIRYEVVSGVFKSLCESIASELSGKYRAFKVGERYGTGYKVIRANDDILELEKPKGKNFGLAMSLLNALADDVSQGVLSVNDLSTGNWEEKLPNSTYDPYLVKGYRNIVPVLIEHMLSKRNEDFRTAEVAQSERPKVLIIDEINRGNVSRIFGELITLIEPSKRAGASEALEVTLPYSKERFSIPGNIHLIGTMNTSDRSLAALDIALRRRFTFIEVPPNPELLEDIEVDGIAIDELLSVMNQRIAVLLDQDHCLGHAYFMPLENDPTLERLAGIFQEQILPLLQEYFFEDWQRIQWVLNDQRKAPENRFLIQPSQDFSVLFGDAVTVGQNNERWELNLPAFDNIESYLGVIDHNLSVSAPLEAKSVRTEGVDIRQAANGSIEVYRGGQQVKPAKPHLREIASKHGLPITSASGIKLNTRSLGRKIIKFLSEQQR
ncbi:McrB family protein [Pseudomonas fragariae (ex Marin et al. 2024)]|uniref:McrB family protein n=1 Tax=Pseudomonas TaxID=286 RepID=UPI00044A2A08|nr:MULTISPECIES: AAA family ATPase [Pseudomonas]AKF47304.1 GTPase subunit of restriction endonuclease [Pseudomonas syringae pv. syringae B301D]EXL33543.1 McrBC-like 5-methylcytosine-specific restriction enzyme, NTPase subunit [Pseudomonas syringae pv. syringae str. B301D-R]MCA5973509.1 AAA family ATPase [Pseudomonas sp. P135]MCH5572781.1 AAA family ATPase [Pseudomonas syringae pv. syringae]PBP63725.1 ATPase [Pseudomonas syringae]